MEKVPDAFQGLGVLFNPFFSWIFAAGGLSLGLCGVPIGKTWTNLIGSYILDLMRP